MKTPSDTSEAWAFVLRHDKVMRRLAIRHVRALSESDKEEWLRDVQVRCVEKYDRYDPKRSAPVTWIYWQMRAVTTTWTRRFAKRCREGYGSHERMLLIPLGENSHGSAEHARQDERAVDASTIIAGLYANATAGQRLAIRTTLAGVPAAELRKRYGMTRHDRNEHLRELRASIPLESR